MNSASNVKLSKVSYMGPFELTPGDYVNNFGHICQVKNVGLDTYGTEAIVTCTNGNTHYYYPLGIVTKLIQ